MSLAYPINMELWSVLQHYFYPVIDAMAEYYKVKYGVDLKYRESAVLWYIYWKLRELIPSDDPFEWDRILSNLSVDTIKMITKEAIDTYITAVIMMERYFMEVEIKRRRHERKHRTEE